MNEYVAAFTNIYRSAVAHARSTVPARYGRLVKAVTIRCAAALTAMRWAAAVAAVETPSPWEVTYKIDTGRGVEQEYGPVPAEDLGGCKNGYYWLVPVMSNGRGRFLPFPWWGPAPWAAVSPVHPDVRVFTANDAHAEEAWVMEAPYEELVEYHNQ